MEHSSGWLVLLHALFIIPQADPNLQASGLVNLVGHVAPQLTVCFELMLVEKSDPDNLSLLAGSQGR